MLFYDVNNGIARRSWARNDEALFAIKREMQRSPNLKITLPNTVEDSLLSNIFEWYGELQGSFFQIMDR